MRGTSTPSTEEEILLSRQCYHKVSFEYRKKAF